MYKISNYLILVDEVEFLKIEEKVVYIHFKKDDTSYSLYGLVDYLKCRQQEEKFVYFGEYPKWEKEYWVTSLGEFKFRLIQVEGELNEEHK